VTFCKGSTVKAVPPVIAPVVADCEPPTCMLTVCEFAARIVGRGELRSTIAAGLPIDAFPVLPELEPGEVQGPVLNGAGGGAAKACVCVSDMMSATIAAIARPLVLNLSAIASPNQRAGMAIKPAHTITPPVVYPVARGVLRRLVTTSAERDTIREGDVSNGVA